MVCSKIVNHLTKCSQISDLGDRVRGTIAHTPDHHTNEEYKKIYDTVKRGYIRLVEIKDETCSLERNKRLRAFGNIMNKLFTGKLLQISRLILLNHFNMSCGKSAAHLESSCQANDRRIMFALGSFASIIWCCIYSPSYIRVNWRVLTTYTRGFRWKHKQRYRLAKMVLVQTTTTTIRCTEMTDIPNTLYSVSGSVIPGAGTERAFMPR